MGRKADQPMPDGLAPPQFPLHVLREYALLADGERAPGRADGATSPGCARRTGIPTPFSPR